MLLIFFFFPWFFYLFIVIYFKRFSLFVCSIVRIRKGWLILTDEFNLSNRSWSTRCSQQPREIPKLDRSWFRPVTISNIGLRGESRTIRTWFILRRCSLSSSYRNLFEKGGERRTGRITMQESVAGLQIFSQPRQSIVKLGDYLEEPYNHFWFRYKDLSVGICSITFAVKLLQFLNSMENKITEKRVSCTIYCFHN